MKKSRDEILRILREVIEEVSLGNVLASRVEESDDLVGQLGLDNMDYASILLQCQTRLGIRPCEDSVDWQNLRTVGQIANFLEGLTDSSSETPGQNDVATVFRSAMRLDENFAIEDRMSFDDIPGWDSVGHMNLIAELESRLGITLEMDEIVALDSVGAVRKLVAQKACRAT